MANLIQRIASRFKKTEERPQETTEVGKHRVGWFDEWAEAWRVGETRRAVHRDADEMDAEDEIVTAALSIIADSAVGAQKDKAAPIELECDDDRLLEDAEEILEIAELPDSIWDICRRLVKHGNDFHEFVIDRRAEFCRLKWLPEEYRIFRNIDEMGRLKNGDPQMRKADICAYDQRDEAGQFMVGFWPFQIVHFRRGRNRYGYGIGLLKSARKNYKRLSILEDSMAIARLTRAYQKLVHRIPVPPNATTDQVQKLINRYKENMTEIEILSWRGDSVTVLSRLKNPLGVSTDFYLPEDGSKRGDITSIDPSNPQLSTLTDIEHFQNKLYAALRVPKPYLNNEKDVNAKATLSYQDLAYARFTGGVQGHVIRGMMDIVSRALFLRGYDPLKVRNQLKIVLPSPFTRDELEEARIRALDATTGDKWIKAKVLDHDTARRRYLGMSDDESAEVSKKVLEDIDQLGDPAPSKGGGMFESHSLRDDRLVLEGLYELRKRIRGGDGSRGDRRQLYLFDGAAR